MAKIICIAFILFGIWVRLFGLDIVPNGLFADEIALGVNGALISEIGTDEFGRKLPFGFGSFSDYKMPGYIYALALFHKFLPRGTTTIRLPSALASVFSLFVVFVIVRLIFPRTPMRAWWASAILAVSPYHIHFGRMAYESMLASFLAFCSIYFAIRLYSTYSIRNILYSSMFQLAASFTYPAPRLFLPVCIVGLGISQWFQDSSLSKRRFIFTSSVIFLVVTLISLLPTLLQPQLDTRTLGYLTSAPGVTVWQKIWWKATNLFLSSLSNFHFSFLFDRGDIYALRHGTSENGVFLPVFIPAYLVGLWYMLRSVYYRKLGGIQIACMLFSTSLPSALTAPLPYGPRILPMILPMAIVLGIGIELITVAMKKWHEFLRTCIYICSFVLFTFQIGWFLHSYFVHFSQKSQTEFPHASVAAAQNVNTLVRENPESKIFYLTGRDCHPWSRDTLKVWYFAHLPAQSFIVHSLQYRDMRFNTPNPFDAYEQIPEPLSTLGQVIIGGGDSEIRSSPPGTYVIRCGLAQNSIDYTKETLVKIFYLYERDERDPLYIITLIK